MVSWIENAMLVVVMTDVLLSRCGRYKGKGRLCLAFSESGNSYSKLAPYLSMLVVFRDVLVLFA